VTNLYEAHAVLLDYSPDTLSVIGCDSGSDKSIDFLGIARGIEAIRALFVALWDRVVFYPEFKHGKQIDVVVQSLPAFEKLAQLEEAKVIGPEQAELLRRKLLGGSEKFVRAGIVTHDITVRAQLAPRELMAPEQKLLSAGVPGAESPATATEPESSPPKKAKRKRSKKSKRDIEQIVRTAVESYERAEDSGEDEE
jgi:hypothetical protein